MESRNGTWRAGKSTLHDKFGYYHCSPGSRHDFKYIITINYPAELVSFRISKAPLMPSIKLVYE